MTSGQTIQARILHNCLLVTLVFFFSWQLNSRPDCPFVKILHICLPWAIFVTLVFFFAWQLTSRPGCPAHSSYLPPLSHICHVSFLLFLAVEHQARLSFCTFFISALAIFVTLIFFFSWPLNTRPDCPIAHSSYLPPLSHICHVSFSFSWHKLIVFPPCYCDIRPDHSGTDFFYIISSFEPYLSHNWPKVSFFLGIFAPDETVRAHILDICLSLAIRIFVIILYLNSVSFPVLLLWRKARPSRYTLFIVASFEPILSYLS